MVKIKNRDESEGPEYSEEASSSKSKQKSQGKKRKRSSSESSNDNEIILADNALETERKVHASAVKNNLDEASVRKILKTVVANDHVLAFVSLKEEAAGSSADDKTMQPKLTRAKVKELKKVCTSRESAAWHLEQLELTPIQHIPVKTRPEVTALIAQDLPDDDEDEEYQPTQDDLPSDDEQAESCSDLDSQPRTPATPAPAESPRLLRDGPFKVPQDIFTARRKLELEAEAATIALRTRSKLSLSGTSIEHIESTFVPPDELPVPDVDDLWNQFLSECLDPASAARHEDDDDADPEYNVAADPDAQEEDEESLSNSIIKISKKELNDLVTELFSILPAEQEQAPPPASLAAGEDSSADSARAAITQWEGKQEPVSDDDEARGRPSRRLTFEKDLRDHTEQHNNERNSRGTQINGQTSGKQINTGTCGKQINTLSEKENIQMEIPILPKLKPQNVAGPRLNISSKNQHIEISIEESERHRVGAGPREAPPALRSRMQSAPQTLHIQMDSKLTMNEEQRLILQQQVRQHVQLATSNFMQTVVHPVHWKLAPQYKEYLVSLASLAEKKEESVARVCNLQLALELVSTWERAVTEDTPDNREMIEFLQNEVDKSRRRINNNTVYGGQFHTRFLQVVANSAVFLYPHLLPCMPYRPDQPRRFCYLRSEDTLIVLGLDQFWSYVESNPELFKLPRGGAAGRARGRRGLVATVELVCKHMFPWITPNRLAGHISAVRAGTDKDNPICRYFKYKEVPRVEHLLVPYNSALTLYEQPEHEMPRIWVRYLASTSHRFRKYLHKRSSHVSRQPAGVHIDPGVAPEINKKPLPIDFTKTIIDTRAALHEKPPEPLRPDKFDIKIQKVEQDTSTTNEGPLVAKNMYRLVETSDGAYLVPLQVSVAPGATSCPAETAETAGPAETPRPADTQRRNNLVCSTEHCMCCVILRKICKERQTLITEYFSNIRKKCDCNSDSYPRISKRLRLLVNNHKNSSEVVFKELERRLNGGERDTTEEEGLGSKDLAHVLRYQLKVFSLASMSKRIHVKQRVWRLLSRFECARADPARLAADISRACGLELTDLYLDFLGFLTPRQAEHLGAFRDYFTRHCAGELMEKVEEQVTDKEARNKILSQLKKTFTSTGLPCEMCASLLGTMDGYPALARYCFNMFPHSRETRAETCGASAARAHSPAPSRAPHPHPHRASSDEESDAMSVDPEPAPAPPEPGADPGGGGGETVIKTEPGTEPEVSVEMSAETSAGVGGGEEASDTSTLDGHSLKIEEPAEWTKEEDRLVLRVLQEEVAAAEDRPLLEALEEHAVYRRLQERVAGRPPHQLRERVHYLLAMLLARDQDQQQGAAAAVSFARDQNKQ